MSDLISREDAIEALEKRKPLFTTLEFTQGVDIGLATAQKVLRELPAAERWIPVSSGDLPKTTDYVLCCTKTQKGSKSIVKGYYDPESKRWCCGMNSNVIAWMDMPPVYEEEEL